MQEPPPFKAPVISLNRLSKSYGKTQVLFDINLDFYPGQVIGYIGPNGAGKSTTVRILAGLDGEFSGEATICGIDVRKDPLGVKQMIGYVPEMAELYDVLTPREFLTMIGRLHNLSDAGTSLAVIVSGLLVMWYDWRLADPLITLFISVWILWHCLTEVVPVIRILMLAAPPGIDPDDIRDRIAAVEGVAGLHHLHLWQIDERRSSLEAHLVLAEGQDAAHVLTCVKEMLAERFSLRHATFEVEVGPSSCSGGVC